MCFVAIYLVPNLQYPANLLAVGEPETIGLRTALYFIMIAVSIAAMVMSAALKRPLAARFGDWNANLLIGSLLMWRWSRSRACCCRDQRSAGPVSAVLLGRFRIASIGSELPDVGGDRAAVRCAAAADPGEKRLGQRAE